MNRHATARVYLPAENATRVLAGCSITKFDRGSWVIPLTQPTEYCEVALQCENADDLDALIEALCEISYQWRREAATAAGTAKVDDLLKDTMDLIAAYHRRG